jgi:hypothetical protein
MKQQLPREARKSEGIRIDPRSEQERKKNDDDDEDHGEANEYTEHQVSKRMFK